MDDRNGRVVETKDIPQDQKEHFIPVMRDMTALEKAEKQIRLYSPCACGSGKKFKFCHYRGGSSNKAILEPFKGSTVVRAGN